MSLSVPVHAMTSGINCQPFSRQGDQAGLSDSRAASFWGTLRARYLCQIKLLVLERTPSAIHDDQLQGALRDFAEHLGLQLHQIVSIWQHNGLRSASWGAVLYPATWPSLVLHRLWPERESIDPRAVFGAYKEQLLFMRHHLWPSVDSGCVLSMRICTSDGADLLLTKDRAQRVEHLLAAEYERGRGYFGQN